MAYYKVIKTNQIIEVYEYSNLNLRSGNGGNYGEHNEETKDENYIRTIRARRDNVRRLATMNFDVKNSKFVTLTFNNQCQFDIKSPIECDRAFKNFILRLKRYLNKKSPQNELKYLAVLEFQDKNKRGAVHYHMICNLPYINKTTLQDIWGNGFIKINAIDKVDNIGAYVVKYMTKEKADNRLKGCKGYLHSNNLSQPLELKDWTQCSAEHEVLRAIVDSMENKKPVYHWEIVNERNTINYKQYNLEREEMQDTNNKNAENKTTTDKMNELFGVGNWRQTM